MSARSREDNHLVRFWRKLLGLQRSEDMAERKGRGMAEVASHLRVIKAGMPDHIVAAHQHSSRHRSEILGSTVCGCFYCGGIFPPSLILDWIDNGRTALCPKCGIDSVLGSASGLSITKELLDEMNKYWF